MPHPDVLITFVNHLKDEQRKLRDQLAPLESGKRIGSGSVGGPWEDVTKIEIDRLKRYIAELQDIIAQYGASHVPTKDAT